MSYITCNNLLKQYSLSSNSFNALDYISLSIDRGEFIAITGPSGSGKSTFMNIVGGLDKPDDGEFTVDSQHIYKMNDTQISFYRNKMIGFVFQSFNLLNSLTAIENVILPLVYAGVPRSKRYSLALEALTQVELEDRISHLPSQLSGGQRQRVSIARAIVNNPEIILADEPTGNLDTHSGNAVMDMLKELHKDGYTVLLVTHDKEQTRGANRIVEICDGRISSDIYI